MKSKSTEKKIIGIIANHHFSASEEKLLIGDVAKMANISRQALNRYYGHLTPYIKGEEPIEELLEESEQQQSASIISTGQATIQTLKDTIKDIKAEKEKEIKSIEISYITTLMNNDLTASESNKIRAALEKQSLHNAELVSQIKGLEVELASAKASLLSAASKAKIDSSNNAEKIKIATSLNDAFKHLKGSGDIEGFEDKKDAALEATIAKLNKVTQNTKAKVIIYCDRYLYSFDEFVDNYQCLTSDTHAFVQMPVYSRAEMQMFRKKIKDSESITIHIPYCSSKFGSESKRRFHYRNVPEYEAQQADKFYSPSINEGFDDIIIFRVPDA